MSSKRTTRAKTKSRSPALSKKKPPTSTKRRTQLASKESSKPPRRPDEKGRKSEQPPKPASQGVPSDGKRAHRGDVFVSYSHRDRFWKDWLLADRMLLTTSGTVDLWSDEDIRPSEDWQERIREALETAKVAVLLVSRNFLSSAFIKDRELPEILEGWEEGRSAILWVPIEAGIEKEAPWLSEIQAVLPSDQPLESLLRGPAEVLNVARDRIYDHVRSRIDPEGWRVSKVLDRKYEVVQLLGTGRTRSVFLGRDHIMKRWVAVLSLRSSTDRIERDVGLDEFRRSLLQASRVDDIHSFLTIYDARIDRNPPHCIRQYVEGETLDRRLEYGGLRYSYVRDILLSLGRGLATAHARNFIHLNIKPSNVLIDEGDRAFLSPLSRRPNYYEIVKLKWSELDEEDRTYVVPEFFDRGAPNSSLRKCDQYLLGMLGYHMIRGGPPPIRVASDGEPPQSLQDFADLPKIKDTACPQGLLDVIERMSQKHPDDRFETLEAALVRLARDSDDALDQARDSYHRIVEAEAEEKMICGFYKALREKILSQPARDAFEKLDEKGWSRQREMLKEAILLLLAFEEFDAGHLDGTGGKNLTVLSRTRRNHRSLQIPAADYDLFRKLLIEAIVTADPLCQTYASVQDEVRRAWRRAIAPGLAYMKSH